MNLDRARALGLVFGYPECCVEAFLELRHLGEPERKFHGTGFVPCETCDREKSVEQLRSEIDAARLHSDPFPRAWGKEAFREADRLAENLTKTCS